MNKAVLKMNSKRLYTLAYEIMGEATPVKADCGELCDKACCRDDGEEVTGMYLFPEENVMFRNMPEGMKLYDTDFEYDYGRYADLITCGGVCQRSRRPLACRIFPLTPYLTKEGELKIITDPRGKGMCPLAKTMAPEELDGEFVSAVRRTANLLMKNRQARLFIEALSRQIDELKETI